MEEAKKAEKKKFPIWIIIVIVIIVVLLGGLSFGANLIKNKITKSLPISVETKDSTYKVKTGTTETVVGEKEIPWPAEIPQDVPKFQGGKIKSVTHDKASNTWVITIGNTTELEFNNYKTYLQNANWKLGDEANVLVNIATMKKGDNQITVVFDPSSKGILISLTPIK